MKGIERACGRSVKKTAHVALVLLLGAAFAALVSAALPCSAAEVRNLKPGEKNGSAVFTYDLVGQKGEKEAEVSVVLILDGKEYPENELHLTGDFGTVKVGKHKRITWHVTKDFADGFDGEIKYRITASSEAGPAESIGPEEPQAELDPQTEPEPPAEKPRKKGRVSSMAASGHYAGGGRMLTETGTVVALDDAGGIVIKTGRSSGHMTVGAAIQSDTVVVVKGRRVPVSRMGSEIAVGDTVTLRYLKGDDLYARQITKQ